MKNKIYYKGFEAIVVFDSSKKKLVGSVSGVSETIGFSSTSVHMLVDEFESEIEGYLERRKLADKFEKALSYANSRFSAGLGYIEVSPSESDIVIAAKIRACLVLSQGQPFKVTPAD